MCLEQRENRFRLNPRVIANSYVKLHYVCHNFVYHNFTTLQGSVHTYTLNEADKFYAALLSIYR